MARQKGILKSQNHVGIRFCSANAVHLFSLSWCWNAVHLNIIQVLSSSWDGRPFNHNRHGPKIRGLWSLFGEGSGSPSNTMSPGLRHTFMPSGILIHPAFWLQQTWAETWEAMPLGVELGPYLTQCDRGRGQPPYQVSSSSVQPFGHSISSSETDRQTDRQRTDSIGRTVLQTVA